MYFNKIPVYLGSRIIIHPSPSGLRRVVLTFVNSKRVYLRQTISNSNVKFRDQIIKIHVITLCQKYHCSYKFIITIVN